MAPSPVVLRAVPEPDAAVVTSVVRPDHLEAREFGYEEMGALVFGRDGGWSLLRTRGGETGWMAPGDGGAFHSLGDLLTDGLTYLTDAWDGALLPAPGASSSKRLWVEVEVLSDSPCETLEEPSVVARGWVPAHGPSGEPTVWFHSRGC